ncbi:hypothetical protein PFICI_03598 [Pestalotiopsis fici W106-1]|uniref:Uncharacterized protein n=1 Tax=Pestalotiopsis fici (strain W106-1 / CGMCC3.15140) TaxID=1229662 RepID=W3XHL6_PESFW|nr:uncharacterized protein PFICI_03598 [Pestalotiopsis fici W106-1]ETS85573.1 hypothetical protein PFICI_03598 [Pestalotiopsis fici W106-1]
MTKSATEAFTGKTESQVVSLLNSMAKDITEALEGILGGENKTLAKIRNDIPEIEEYAELVSAGGCDGDKLFEHRDEDTRTKWVEQYDERVQNAEKLEIDFE